MDVLEKHRRYLGIPTPYSVRFVVGLLGVLFDWVLKHWSEPEMLRRELARRREQFLELDRGDRENACDRAARKGRLILEMRTLHGRHAWEATLAELRVSRRTAGNYMGLYLFSKDSPALYERFKVLGPTKLYRLSRVAPDVLKEIKLTTAVPTQDGPVPLGRATDAQLASFLKLTFPPRKRSHAEKLREAATRVSTLAARWPHGEKVSPDTLEAAATAARAAEQMLGALAKGPPRGGRARPDEA